MVLSLNDIFQHTPHCQLTTNFHVQFAFSFSLQQCSKDHRHFTLHNKEHPFQSERERERERERESVRERESERK